jgi:hypothetical protein
MNQTIKPLANNASGTAMPIVPTGVGNKTVKPVDGYTGVQGKTDNSYKPGDDSLVKNQVAGLLDPNSPLMRKAVSQSQGFAAARGLQSSSIANESALSSMVDKAMPIAQQDANTNSQAEQLGWQQNWQSGENNLNRTHDASMADKQGLLQQFLQKDGQTWQAGQNDLNRQHDQTIQSKNQSWQAGQNSLNRQHDQSMQTGQQAFQKTMQELQHQQSLGMLDAQGKQQLQHMERSSQLQTDRDKMLQQFQLQNMDKSYLQQLEQTRVQYEQQDKVMSAQWNMQTQAEYRNASAAAYNNYLAQVGAVYADPGMTNEQKAAGATYLQSQMESQRKMLETIYGFANTGQSNATPAAVAPPVSQVSTQQPVSKPNIGISEPGQSRPYYKQWQYEYER